MEKKRAGKMAVRCFSVLLMVFSVAFAITWNGYCLGDEVFARLGLKAWSDGPQGGSYIINLFLLYRTWEKFQVVPNKSRFVQVRCCPG